MYLQDHELISASMSGDIMTVVSLLNSGADIQTEVCMHLNSFVYPDSSISCVCHIVEFWKNSS